MIQLSVDLLGSVCSQAVPVAVVFYIGCWIVDSFFSLALPKGGRKWY